MTERQTFIERWPGWLPRLADIGDQVALDLAAEKRANPRPGRYRVFARYSCATGETKYMGIRILHEDNVFGPGPGVEYIGYTWIGE